VVDEQQQIQWWIYNTVYTVADTQRQIHSCRYTAADTQLQIYSSTKSRYTVVDTQQKSR